MGRIILNSGWINDITLGDLFGDYNSTTWIEFAEDEKNIWALVLHCVEEEAILADEEGLPDLKMIDVIYGKLAYCPKNSAMQEYDIDWLMTDINGMVYDTEYDIPSYATDKRILLTLKDWEDGMNYLVKRLGLEV